MEVHRAVPWRGTLRSGMNFIADIIRESEIGCRQCLEREHLDLEQRSFTPVNRG